MIIEGTNAIDNSKNTIINNTIEEDRLETIKEKGVITVAGPPKESPFFFYKSQNK